MDSNWKEISIQTQADSSSLLRLPSNAVPGARGRIRLTPSNLNESNVCSTAVSDVDHAFDVQALLGKNPTTTRQLSPNFQPTSGESNILLPEKRLVMTTPDGEMSLWANAEQELSVVGMTVSAVDFMQARQVFQQNAIETINFLSTRYNIPIYVNALRIIEKSTAIMEFYTTVGFPDVSIAPIDAIIFSEMRWIYAQFREGRNSRSEFYRFLCFYKIMEFLLRRPQKDVRARCIQLGLNVPALDYTMPAGDGISPEHQALVGKSIQQVFDGLSEERKAVAHFMLEDNRILDLALLESEIHFAKAAYVSELCCRVLIQNHEILLNHIRSDAPSDAL